MTQRFLKKKLFLKFLEMCTMKLKCATLSKFSFDECIARFILKFLRQYFSRKPINSCFW